MYARETTLTRGYGILGNDSRTWRTRVRDGPGRRRECPPTLDPGTPEAPGSTCGPRCLAEKRGMGVQRVLATTACVCLVAGVLMACATRSNRPGAPFPRDAAQQVALERVEATGPAGVIVLSNPTWLADLLLKPGRYEFQRIDGGDAHLRVMEIKRYWQFKRPPHDSKKLVAEVRCEMEALAETAAQGAVQIRSEAGIVRVDWVALAGQDDRCLPRAVLR